MLGKDMNKGVKNVAVKQQHMIYSHSSIMAIVMKKKVNYHTFRTSVKCARILATTVVTIVTKEETVMKKIMKRKMIKIVILVTITTAIAMILMMTMITLACLQICESLTKTVAKYDTLKLQSL